MLARTAPATLLATVLCGGCATIGPGSPAALDTAMAKPAAGLAAPAAAPVPAKPESPVGPAPVISEQQAMADIAPALAKIAAADPALHAEVLEQLGGTRPNLWSLTVQRAEHTLAYRQQLAAKDPEKSTPGATPTPASAPSPTPASAPSPTPAVMLASATAPAEAAIPRVVGGSPPAPVIANKHYQAAPAAAADAPATATLLSPAAEPAVEARVAMQQKAAEEEEERSWREHLASAIATFQETEGVKPTSRDAAQRHVRLRLMQLASGDSDAASEKPPGLPPSEQGYWSNQVWAMSTLLDAQGTDRQAKIDAASQRQEEASAKLRALGAMQVRNFAACDAVYGYGAYEPTQDARYAPGEQVVLYAEIDNYRSDATDDGFRTVITSAYRLINDRGDDALSGEFPEVDDLCLTRRRDFHIRYGVTLPSDLPPGDYRLELAVTDRLAEKTGHSELPLTVVTR